MGAVYLGFDNGLQRKVALKVMLPQYAANREVRERFLRDVFRILPPSEHAVGDAERQRGRFDQAPLEFQLEL